MLARTLLAITLVLASAATYRETMVVTIRSLRTSAVGRGAHRRQGTRLLCDSDGFRPEEVNGHGRQ